MLSSRLARWGEVSVTIYDASEVGDELAWHTHDDLTAHGTIVSRGLVLFTADGIEPRVLAAGAHVDTPAHVYHSFKALSAGARWTQIPKNPTRRAP